MARTTAANFAGGLQFPMANAASDLFKKEDVQTLALAVDGHDHSTGKGLVLPASAIPPITSAMIADGTITSADILDGTIATADLAVHAVSRVWSVQGVAGSPQTTVSTLADIPDLVVTLTTTDVVDLAVLLSLQVTNSLAAAFNTISLSLDGVDAVQSIATQVATANGHVALTFIFSYIALAAATHTIKGRWSTTTGTLASPSGLRQLMVLEHKR